MLIFSTMRAQIIIDTTMSSNIKTVILSGEKAELDPPLLILNGQEKLIIKFDQLGDEPQAYRYKIKHCDNNWRVDEMEPYEFINGFDDAPIENHQFSFTTIEHYINYYQSFPSGYSTFLISGNYALFVYLQDDPDNILFTRRFQVTEQLLTANIESVKSSNRPMENQEINVSLESKSPENRHLLNPTYLTVKIQQNGRLDNQRILPFNSYCGEQLCYKFKEENVFPGGNCFRFFDVSNLRTPMYNVNQIERFGGETFAILTPEKNRSITNFSLTKTLMGGMKINVWDRNNPTIEADYLWVNFCLPAEQPYLTGNLHIVGQITNWSLGDTSLMEWNPKIKAYTKRIFLKQGYYTYQILLLPNGESTGITDYVEGNHYETPNEYNINVYSRWPGERYDRLISVGKFIP